MDPKCCQLCNGKCTIFSFNGHIARPWAGTIKIFMSRPEEGLFWSMIVISFMTLVAKSLLH